MSMLTMPLSNSCSVCGCSTVSCESTDVSFQGIEIREHTNGERWDRRRFACGQTVRWIPNFQREEVVESCQNNDEYKTKQALYKSLCKQVSDLEDQKRELMKT